MTEAAASNQPNRAGNGNGKALRRLALAFAIAALVGSLWAAISGAGCEKCHAARTLLDGIPLAWAGVAYYAILAIVIGWKGLTGGTRCGFFAAMGVHAVLVSLLARQRLLCGPCLLVASAALAGAVVSLVGQPRAWRWAALPFGITALLALMGISTAGIHPSPAIPATTTSSATEELPDGDVATRPAEGHVKLVLYEREGCKHCLQFEEDILPRLREALGASLEIEKRDATLDMETPTIVVVGKGNTTFVGVPAYEDLATAAANLR